MTVFAYEKILVETGIVRRAINDDTAHVAGYLSGIIDMRTWRKIHLQWITLKM